jgi:anaerobic selenocysteine-containing dehydrogenase
MPTNMELPATSTVKSTCYMCYNACGIVVHRQGNLLVKIEGDPDNPQNSGRLCAKGRSGLQSLYDPARVRTPLRRRNPEKGVGIDPQWEPVSWQEALQTVAGKLKKIRAEDPRKLVGCMFDAHVYTQFFSWMAAFGSPNGFAGGAGFYCGNGLHPVAALTSGTFFLEPDLDYCNYLIMVGTQNGFVVNHLPMMMSQKMADAQARGMKLIVVDPICTAAGSHADQWIPIKPGTDASFALAMANVLVNELGLYDEAFLKQHTNAPYLIGADGRYVRQASSNKPLVWDRAQNRAIPFDEARAESLALTGSYEAGGKSCRPSFQCLKDHLLAYTPEQAAGITDIAAATIRNIAAEFGKAANVGATVEVDGQTLPLRAACVNWYRGPCAHRHGFLTGFALQLLNVLIGAIDVPGGHLGSNPVGPWWEPGVSEDGLLLPTDHPLAHQAFDPYPGRKPQRPDSVTGMELFPVAPYASTLIYDILLDPGLYDLPYQPEMMIVCRSNPMMSTINPGIVEQALKKIPFIVAFAFNIDETTEMADIVLPDAHYLERTDAFTNAPYEFIAAGMGEWNFMIRQPAAEPPEGVRHWMEVLFELAGPIGFQDELNAMLNQTLPLRAPYTLEDGRSYSWNEINDHWLKSHFGEDRGLDWFRRHGFINYRKKTVREAYPRPFLSSRMPIYLEHLLDIGEALHAVTAKAGIPWDVADYQPIPDWKPCAAHLDEAGSEYDLFAVNCKAPFHTFSSTVGNPVLTEIQNAHKFGANILLNHRTAANKGIQDGAEVWVESTAGFKVRGSVKLTDCVRPDVVGFMGLYGKWARNVPEAGRKGPHFNTLLPYGRDRIDTVATTVDMCIRVKVYPAAAEDAGWLAKFANRLHGGFHS